MAGGIHELLLPDVLRGVRMVTMGWFLKPVFTYSERERKIRLLRFGYNRRVARPYACETCGSRYAEYLNGCSFCWDNQKRSGVRHAGDWISWVVSLTIWAKWFHWEKGWHQWYVVVCGLGVHFRKSAGGYES